MATAQMIVALHLGYQVEEKGDKGGKSLVDGSLRISSHPYKDPDLGWFEPRIALGSDPEMSLRISHPQWSDRANSSFSEIRAINVDGFYDELRDADFEGQIADLRFGPEDLPWDELPYRWRMRVERLDFAGEEALIVRLRSLASALDVPVQRERFPDSTPEESTRDQLKPLILGGPLQCPTILLDGSNQRRFLAANSEGQSFVGEGGLEIEEGTDPGEYTVIDGTTIELNSEPTLMVTADPIGPLHEVWPLPQSRFTAFENAGGGFQRPTGWTWTNFINPNRSLTRVEDGLVYCRNSTTGTLSQTRAIRPGDYRLRIRMREEPGLTNRGRLSVQSLGFTTTSLLPNTSIQAADGEVEFSFTVPFSAGSIRLNWTRDIDGSFVNAELHLTELSLRQVGTPASSIDQLSAIVANEMADPPYPPELMDWVGLDALSAVLGDLQLAAWLEGSELASSVLDDLFASCYSSWWTDPAGRLTCGRLTPPSGTPVITIDDATRTSQINVLQDLPDRLTRGQRWAKNWTPIPEDRAAADLNSGIQARNAREYRTFNTVGGSLLAGLPQRYRTRLAEDLRPTLIKSMPINPRPTQAELANYQQARRLWQVQAVISPLVDDLNQIQPLAPVEIRSRRFGIEDGILTRIVGMKLKPLSGYIELILWG